MKITKLISAFLLSTLTAAVIALTSYAADTVTTDMLGNCVCEQQADNTAVSVLVKSRSVKGFLHVDTDEFIVIPENTRLILRSGAKIDGNVFIENGAQINVLGGELRINGSVVCDGKITINSKSELSISGDLIVLKDGLLKLGSGAGFVCESNSNVITASDNAIAAVVCRINPFDNSVLESAVLTEQSETLIPDHNSFYRAQQSDGIAGTSLEYISVLFDNGSFLRTERTAEKYYSQINGVDIRAALIAIDKCMG